MPPKQLTHQAREAIALAFEGIGSLPALIAWAKNHRMIFYTQLYAKLIPVSLSGAVDLNVQDQNAEQDHAALARILHGLIAERDNPSPVPSMKVSHDGAGLVIDAVVNPPAPPPPPAPPQNAEATATENVVRLNRAPDTAPPTAAQHPHPTSPSTTAFYEWNASGAGSRPWWGGVGENGGGPP